MTKKKGDHEIDFGGIDITIKDVVVAASGGYDIRRDPVTGKWLRRDTRTELINGVLVTTDSGEYEVPSLFGDEEGA